MEKKPELKEKHLFPELPPMKRWKRWGKEGKKLRGRVGRFWDYRYAEGEAL